MYEKEEEKLNEFRKQLEQVNLSLELADGAILQGMERAKREKQVRRIRQNRGLWTLAVSAILMITLVTSIRISPTFANTVATIPGMEKIVALIHNDKGLTAIIENDYYQEIGVSQTKESLTLTIDGVILDESGINIFYTLNSSQSLEYIQIQSVQLGNNAELPQHSTSFGGTGDEESINVYSDRVDVHFVESFVFDDLAFTFNIGVSVNGEDIEFTLPFEVPENVKPSTKFTINEELEIDNQKFTIEEITVHPLRVGVKVSFNPTNTMKILQFDDMRLEDENGEVWGSIMNGVSGRDISDAEKVYYLKSNYFEKPKELYLRINKLQALDRDEAYVIVDTEKNLLIKSPQDGKLHLGDTTKSKADFYLTDSEDDEHNYDLFTSVKDADGINVYTPSTEMYTYEQKKHWSISFEITDYTNPLQLELFSYPNYLEGDVKVELNKPNK